MNILYISSLSGKIAAGPSWSVPASIVAQSLYDDVIWIDTGTAKMQHWLDIPAYHNIEEIGGVLDLEKVVSKFFKPDLVVFESFYIQSHVRFSSALKKNNIPYIIVPRGALTYNAIHNGKALKKNLAFLFVFNSFLKHSVSVQYLTEREKQESSRFNVKSFVLPNGTSMPSVSKHHFSDGIKSVFIGRVDLYVKGLDMLLQAIYEQKQILTENGFSLRIYGPTTHDTIVLEKSIEDLGIKDLVVITKESVSGKEKERVLLDSDLFVLTSRTEGFPMGLIEALSYGLPVMITRGTNLYNEINAANAGWCSETNAAEIARALKSLCLQKFMLAEKGNNALLLAQRYSWTKLAKDFHNIVKNLV